MTVLNNELGEQLSSPTLVVMDDYHYTTSLVVHQLVDFLLENGPINLHIIISTLSGRGAERASNVISSLSGSQRFVFEYLTEEVFRRQPGDMQRFLLRTAVMAQMDSASCNTIAQVHEAQQT